MDGRNLLGLTIPRSPGMGTQNQTASLKGDFAALLFLICEMVP